jgi:hypothetical protein
VSFHEYAVILSNEPWCWEPAKILKLDRWWIENVILYPRSKKSGWPLVAGIAEEAPKPRDPFEALTVRLKRWGIPQWRIDKKVAAEKAKMAAMEAQKAARRMAQGQVSPHSNGRR